MQVLLTENSLCNCLPFVLALVPVNWLLKV